MTLKAKIGKISGTVDQPVVPVTVFDSAEAQLDYDDAKAYAIAAAYAEYPTLLGCNLRQAEVSINELSGKAITWDVPYKRPGRNVLLRSASEQTKAKKMYNFVEPKGVYGVDGADVTSSYGHTKWKLDRQGSAAEFNSGKPVTVDPLNESRTLTYNTSQSFINDAYLDAVEDVVQRGCFNDAVYLGRAVASLQLVRFSANERDYNDWELSFGLGYRAFKASVVVGDGVVIPELRGCDHYWPIEKETYSAGGIQPKVKAVVVGQAWELETLQDLHIPTPGILTTRTDDDTGVFTDVADGHGITGSDQAIIFWDGGQQVAEVSTVSTGTISTSGLVVGPHSDALPILGTPILIAKYVP
jgi:hypothetical protein